MQKVTTKIWVDGDEENAIQLDRSVTDCEEAARLLNFDGDFSELNFEHTEHE